METVPKNSGDVRKFWLVFVWHAQGKKKVACSVVLQFSVSPVWIRAQSRINWDKNDISIFASSGLFFPATDDDEYGFLRRIRNVLCKPRLSG